MFLRCCCGKKDISEPIIINDYVHEPFGVEGNFCGPLDKHDIRDLTNKVEELSRITTQYLDFYEACMNNREHNKNFGASETNTIAVRFRKALDGK